MIRLAIVSSHPIQYNAPLFKLLSSQSNISVCVFYSWEGAAKQNDPEFGRKITWDIPLLEGYESHFVSNRSSDPGTHHFFGLDNPEMVAKIESWHPDVLLVYGWAFKTHLAVLRYFCGRVPLYFRGDSTLLSSGGMGRKIARWLLLKWVYSHVDYALYPGQRSKEYFLAYGLKPDQLIYVPHSVDNKRFQDNAVELEREADVLRQSLGIHKHAFVVLFAGKLVPRKQPGLLLAAVKELIDSGDGTSLHLIFAGDGELMRSLKGLAGNSMQIHFIGFKNQQEMPLVYRLGDIVVLPSSENETWGLAVNEAMACGRAVIASDRVGCSVDLIKNGVTGEIFPSREAEELKSVVVDCMRNRDRVMEMGKTAQIFINNWSTEKAVEKIAMNLTMREQV